MKDNLVSSLWPETAEKIRLCHVSRLKEDQVDTEKWQDAFKSLIQSIEEERKTHPFFAAELSELTEATGFDYDFKDILEEYFDHLEELNDWDHVIESCDTILKTFDWSKAMPSEYNYRKGNALQQSKRYEEAEAFGREWLEKYPKDLYAAASNAFLLISLGKMDEAEAVTEKYLRKELICDRVDDTFFLAAYELYAKTDDVYAKQRVQRKIAEYIEMENNLKKGK